MRNAHKVVAARRREQNGEVFNVVLVGFHVVRVARVAAHRHARELAHEMVFQPRALHLPRVVEILRADEADDGVDQKRRKMPRKAVAAGLHRYLIGAVVRVARELRALTRLKIHHVRPRGRAARAGKRLRVFEGRGGKTEGFVALLRACDGLKHKVGRSALLQGAHLRRHMGKNAGLRGDFKALLDLFKAPENARGLLGALTRGIQTQNRVARAEAQTFAQGGENAVGIVRRVVRLQAARKRAFKADGRVAVGGDAHFFRRVD